MSVPTEAPADASAARLFLLSAERLHGGIPTAEKVSWVLEQARQVTGASVAAFVELAGSEIRVVEGHFPFLATDDGILLDALRGAVREATTRWLGPVGADGWPLGGANVIQAVAIGVPRSADQPGSALVVGWVDHPPAGVDLTPLQALSLHLGAALDNDAAVQRLAELEAMQREAVHQLQEAVRPFQPEVAEAELGVYYLPADAEAPTGGDLYDWHVLPNGDLHLVVVDVLGKGVGATKDALAVTHALRLLAIQGCPLADMVVRAHELLTAQTPDLVATMLVGRYSPETASLRLAGAGHPPALVVGADGAVRQVSAPGVPIGWPGAGSDEVVTVTLDRGETVILYTDGLIEATKDVLAGLKSLEEAATETAGYPARQLAEALVERALAGAARRDDSLALILRRRTPPKPSEGTRRLGPFAYRFSPVGANVPLVRHALADWLRHQGVEDRDVADLLIVASELCANAVRASTGSPGALELSAHADDSDGAVVLEVSDDGPGFEWPAPRRLEDAPDPSQEFGRGLFLVTALTDDVTVAHDEGQTRVTATKRAALPRL